MGQKSLVNKKAYEKKYQDSIKNNDSFWKKEGKRITWIKPYKKICICKSQSTLSPQKRSKSTGNQKK